MGLRLFLMAKKMSEVRWYKGKRKGEKAMQDQEPSKKVVKIKVVCIEGCQMCEKSKEWKSIQFYCV